MYNRRRSARRKLWEVTAYKGSEQHISDSDDEQEKKTKYRKREFVQYCGKNALEDWTSCGSGFDSKEFQRDKICDDAYSSKEEPVIETASYSDDDNLHSTQLSISEVSSNKSACSSTKKKKTEGGDQDIHEDSSECSTPTSISDLSEDLQISNKQVHNVSYAISPPSSPIGSTSSNAKGSDWLLKIPWQPRNQKEFCSKTEFDSGKKKKKFISGGFADQLYKLQSREKSAKAFWDHHIHDARRPLCGKESIILKLMDTTSSYGTVVCRAVTVKSHHQNVLNLLDSYTNCVNSETNLVAKDTMSERLYEKYIVLLDCDQYEKLSLSAGNIIQLFPPWTVLHAANLTEPVLLCTYFLRVTKNDQLFLTRDEKQNYQKEDGEVT